MKLVEAEYSFEGNKVLFFFTAEGRVDFRALVKDLASTIHARIELRQIGVRDEAKMLGGLGICGRPFCCAQFLDEFQPVSIKMAKTQNLSLNPTKISGTCGRLMCCLKYEQEAYEDLVKHSPKQESLAGGGDRSPPARPRRAGWLSPPPPPPPHQTAGGWKGRKGGPGGGWGGWPSCAGRLNRRPPRAHFLQPTGRRPGGGVQWGASPEPEGERPRGEGEGRRRRRRGGRSEVRPAGESRSQGEGQQRSRREWERRPEKPRDKGARDSGGGGRPGGRRAEAQPPPAPPAQREPAPAGTEGAGREKTPPPQKRGGRGRPLPDRERGGAPAGGGAFSPAPAVVVLLMLMAVGYFMGTKGWMKAEEKKFLSKYIINIAVPCNCINGLLNNLDQSMLAQAGLMLVSAIIGVVITIHAA